MHSEPLHTRFRLSPSGPVHVGHAALAWLSQNAARATGGTFTLRAQQLWNTRNADSWEIYQRNVKDNFDQLIACGLGPSSVESFLLHDMDPAWRLQYTDDRASIDWHWEKCDFGIKGFSLSRLFGPWPPGGSTECAADIPSQSLGPDGHYRSYHPYIRIAQIVGEITTGRNCIIRGKDHEQEKVFTAYLSALIAKEHYHLPEFDTTGRYDPIQYFLPLIEVTGGGKISSSDTAGSADFFLRDVLDAGVPPDALQQYLGKVLFGTAGKAQQAYTAWSDEPVWKPRDAAGALLYRFPAQKGACYVFEVLMVPKPYIDRDDWLRFLRTHEVGI